MENKQLRSLIAILLSPYFLSGCVVSRSMPVESRPQLMANSISYTSAQAPAESSTTYLFSETMKAAQRNDSSAQHMLGHLYETGQGTVKDDREAIIWYRKAAVQSLDIAQVKMGQIYADGLLGIPKNDQIAIFWYQKAADQGLAIGQYYLGVMYANGRGVTKDERLAVVLYRKAALQGLALSQVNLGSMYKSGLGSNSNLQLAYFWFLVAANGAHQTASWVSKSVLLELEKSNQLSPSQQLQAKKIANLWVVGNPEPLFKNHEVIAPTPNSVKPNTLPSTATVSSTGSGFRVSTNQVVTNAHVVAGCSRLRVNGLAANLQSSDKQVDLALITVNGLAGTIANIRSDAVRVGEDVAAAGYPLRGLLSGFNITRGNVSSLTGLGGARWLFQITAPVQPGNSGGPLVDGAGNVAGAVVSKLSWKAAIALDDIPQNVNFAVNLGALQSFLKANSVRYQSASTGNTQMNLADVAEQAKHYTALVECL